MRNILITGGAGYVGSALVPKLLDDYKVTVYDLFLYGDPFETKKQGRKKKNLRNLTKVKADIRNEKMLRKHLKDKDTVMHLACISNDPSYELNPSLSKLIDHYGARKLVDICEEMGIRHFIYASSSSVYGIVPDYIEVTERIKCNPLTSYSRCKLGLEEYIKMKNPKMAWTVYRPATICGYTNRLRLDTVVNLLTAQALINNKITVFGGEQYRANINVKDMVRAYQLLLEAPLNRMDRQIFNVGDTNIMVKDIATKIKEHLGLDIEIETTPTNDPRSYRLNADKIKEHLRFKSNYGIDDAISSIKRAYYDGLIVDGLNNPIYHNVKLMKGINLK